MRVKIIAAFEGYPHGGDMPSVHYAPGEEADVPDEFAANIIGKNLAERVEDTAMHQVIHEA